MMVLRILTFKALLLFGLFVFSAQGLAENVVSDHKKAQLMSKFIKNIRWPPESRRLKFTLGVYNDTKLFFAMKSYFSNKKIKNKTITVFNVSSVEQAQQVNLLYIPTQHSDQLAIVAERARKHNVLLVSENSADTANAMINLLLNVDSREISFDINKTNISTAALGLSSWVTLNANKDVAAVEQDSYNSKQTIEQKTSQTTVNNGMLPSAQQEKTLLATQLASLVKQVLSQEKKLQSRLQQLKASNNNINRNTITSKKQLKKLQRQKQKINEQEQDIKINTRKLAAFTEQLKRQRNQNKQENNEQLLKSSEKVAQQIQQISVLTEQLAQAEKQQTLLNKQALEQAPKQVPKQAAKPKVAADQHSSSNLLYYVLVIAGLALLLATFVWLRYKKINVLLGETSANLALREQQLVKSEQVASLGYIASDITYAAGAVLDDVLEQCKQAQQSQISSSLQPMATLLENFNQIAADQDEEDKKPFDLIIYVNKIMSLFSVEFKHRQIEYIYSGETKLVMNTIPSRIALLILNLVDNALKHGFADNKTGKITINIEKTQQGKVKIIFTDNGMGMDSNTLKQVFTPFFTTQNVRGYVGIGMSTSHDIVNNKLSGNIKIFSKPEQGTEVVITVV